MALRKKKNYRLASQLTDEQKQAMVQALQGLQPQSKMGRRLIELSLQGLESGVEPMSTEDILDYLGRNRNYENLP